MNQWIPDDDLRDPGKVRFKVPSPAIHIIDENGDRVKVKQIDVFVDYETIESFVPFDFRRYFDEARKIQLYTAAVASINVPGVKGELMIVQEDGIGSKVVFVPMKGSAN